MGKGRDAGKRFQRGFGGIFKRFNGQSQVPLSWSRVSLGMDLCYLDDTGGISQIGGSDGAKRHFVAHIVRHGGSCAFPHSAAHERA